jgi:hypothetical protein
MALNLEGCLKELDINPLFALPQKACVQAMRSLGRPLPFSAMS